MPREVPLSHPGEILNEDYLKPMAISQYALSKAIGVPPRRINEIVKGQRGITIDTALRLAAFFRYGFGKLDQSANPLRYRTGTRSNGRSAVAHPPLQRPKGA